MINQTEALVAVDINSGKATREHNIEDTALQDQPRGGRRDRPPAAPARLGRPHRHRLHRHGGEAQQPQRRAPPEGCAEERPGPHPGRPHQPLRPARNVAAAPASGPARRLVAHLPALRRPRRGALDPVVRPLRAARHRGTPGLPRKPENLTVRCTREIAFYILNEKRDNLLSIETTYGISVFVDAERRPQGLAGADRARRQSATSPPRKVVAAPVRMDFAFEEEDEEDENEAEATEIEAEADDENGAEDAGESRRRGAPERQSVNSAEGGPPPPPVAAAAAVDVAATTSRPRMPRVTTSRAPAISPPTSILDQDGEGERERHRGERRNCPRPLRPPRAEEGSGDGERRRPWPWPPRDRFGRGRDRERGPERPRGEGPRPPRGPPPESPPSSGIANRARPLGSLVEIQAPAPAPVAPPQPVAEAPAPGRAAPPGSRPPRPLRLSAVERKSGWWSKRYEATNVSRRGAG